VYPGTATDLSEDGVVIDSRYFGTVGTVEPPYNLGRTTTHELGHYFGLLHPFRLGLPDPCSYDDGVDDTPRQSTGYQGACPRSRQQSCGSSDMYMNFMNLTDDACLAAFTRGQKARALAALQLWRSGLLESGAACSDTLPGDEDFTFRVSPNPASGSILLDGGQAQFPKVDLRIFDVAGRLVFEHPNWPTAQAVELQNYSPGLYFAEAKCGDKRWAGKFIKL
jgi:hypothetical protein